MSVYFLALYSVPLTHVSVSVSVPHCFDYCSLKSGSVIPPAFFFFFKIALAVWGLLWLYITFRIICSNSLKKKIPFKNHMKKYLGINLTKEIKDVYSENYKTLIKGIEDDLKK